MANGLKKSKDDIIQEDLKISEEVLAEIPKAKASKDAYAIPELKKKDIVVTPGHTRRDFRN
jgi:hypothetical protein